MSAGKAFITSGLAVLLALPVSTLPAGNEGALSKASRRVLVAHERLMSAPSSALVQRAYLDAFPGDWKTFLAVFMDEPAYGQLYSNSHDYIWPLEDIGRKFPEETFGKLLPIGSRGRWNSDGVGVFQNTIIKLALEFPREFAHSMSGLKPEAQQGLLFFMADGPHGPDEEAFAMLVKRLEGVGFLSLARRVEEAGIASEARSAHGH